MLSEEELAPQIAEMHDLIGERRPPLVITQDLGIGMMLWMAHFSPQKSWARIQQSRCLVVLDGM